MYILVGLINSRMKLFKMSAVLLSLVLSMTVSMSLTIENMDKDSRTIENGTSDGQTSKCFPTDDYTILKTLPKPMIGVDLPGFHYTFVSATGQTFSNRRPYESQVEIVGSPSTSQLTLRTAADVVSKMTKYMPNSIFNNLASSAGAGVFTADEKLTVFPEFSNLASSKCGTKCCSFDGSRYEDLPGVGGQRAVVLDDNLMCMTNDPFRHEHNILSYEFTHTIHNYALSSTTKQQITSAFNKAKLNATWTASSYSIVNDQEYFAQGTSAFFGVNKDNYYLGGMNKCDVDYVCNTEQDSRDHLLATDPDLYKVLSYVFTNNRPHLLSKLTICPSDVA